ncbi:MAG: putative polysaccharide biosynthesis protein [Anaerovoracaceae bacterium]|jgi:stage V sporulation protein B
MAKDNRFVKGAAILAGAGLVIKVLGAVFRIPLNNWIGALGMSYYSAAYSVYGALLVLATAGIPVAISRMVSERIAVKQYRNAHQVFRSALLLLFVIGLIGFCICFFGGDLIARYFAKNPGSGPALKAISPALLFVPLFSAFRGYFNGQQNMTPQALSEISEQLTRVVVGLTLAYILLDVGKVEAAAGASFGASAGSIMGLFVIFLIYLANRRRIKRRMKRGDQTVESTGSLIRQIAIIAIPIIIGTEMYPMMNLIDTGLVTRVLQNTGWSVTKSEYLYGLIGGFCSPLIAFPQIMTQAVSVSLVPALSGKHQIGDTEALRDTIRTGYRTTLIMAFPCALGLFSLAEPILKLLYFTRAKSCEDAAPILMIMAVGVVFLAIMQTSTSVLQAVGKQMLPVRNLAIGCVGKIILTYTLVGVHPINVKGAAIGTVTAYVIAMFLNARDVRKYTGVTFDYGLTYVRPLISSLIMAVCAYGIYQLIYLLFAGHSPMLVNALAVVVAILAAIIIYAVLVLVTKTVTLEELEENPKGAKLARFIRRLVD